MSFTTAQIGHLNKMNEAAQAVSLGTVLSALESNQIYVGTHTVTAAEETSGTLDIDSGYASGASAIVQVLASGAVATSDVAVSVAAGVLTVADGSSFSVTENQIINYIVF